MKEGLTQKQKMFCLEYLKDFNGTRAYKQVYGGTDDSARRQASRLLTNVHVQEFLGSRVEKKMDKLDVGVDFVLSGLKEIALIGMGKQKVMKNGKEQYILDLSNANSAYEKLGKYNKLFTDKVEQSGDLNINIVSYKKGQN